ncbi:hypothetical protein MNBD_GAMMA21-2692 [hydrothermal vent metagenome]|uniref:CULT domain-containing protein n=1 Tax=hydrothermal vent metagenome TaxID=652676 RepID=A0A3B1B939_9ZZZZ
MRAAFLDWDSLNGHELDNRRLNALPVKRPSFANFKLHISTFLLSINGYIRFFDRGKPEPGLDTFDTSSKNNPDANTQLKDEEQQAGEAGGIFCANCHTLLTHAKYAIAVAGQYQHVFTNPNSISFKIRTYQQVECNAETTAVDEFSWFSGYAWRIISCPQCSQHIGWSYHKQHSPDFYGLIADKLIDLHK